METQFDVNFIKEATHKKHFTDPLARTFLIEWAKRNSAIDVQFLSREEWQRQNPKNIFFKNQILLLPEDLYLWEMIDIIKQVDADTYVHDPELAQKKSEELRDLGRIFKNAGRYIKTYQATIPDLPKNNTIKTGVSGRKIAEEMAQRFYEYGLALTTGQWQPIQKKERKDMEEEPLTADELQEVDYWFLGRTIYERRMEKMMANNGKGATDKSLEAKRKELLNAYFTGLARTRNGIFANLQQSATEHITHSIETPYQEIGSVLFRRGVEMLVKNIGFGTLQNKLIELQNKEVTDTLTPSEQINKLKLETILPTIQRWQSMDYTTIYQGLEIPKLRKELEVVKKTGDVRVIVQKELEIAGKIHQVIHNLPYGLNRYSPAEIMETQSLNCIGASLLFSSLLKDVGIQHLFAEMPNHAITVLVTSDEKLYWQDVTINSPDITPLLEITDNDFIIGDKASLLQLNKSHSLRSSLFFRMQPEWFENKISLETKDMRKFVIFSTPEIGAEASVNYNIGNTLANLGEREMAIIAFERVLQLNSVDVEAACKLGDLLMGKKYFTKAVWAYQKAIEIDTTCSDGHHGLGNALLHLERYKEAIGHFLKAIELDPGDIYPRRGLSRTYFLLGDYQNAALAAQQALDIDGDNVAMLKILEDSLPHTTTIPNSLEQ